MPALGNNINILQSKSGRKSYCQIAISNQNFIKSNVYDAGTKHGKFDITKCDVSKHRLAVVCVCLQSFVGEVIVLTRHRYNTISFYHVSAAISII